MYNVYILYVWENNLSLSNESNSRLNHIILWLWKGLIILELKMPFSSLYFPLCIPFFSPVERYKVDFPQSGSSCGIWLGPMWQSIHFLKVVAPPAPREQKWKIFENAPLFISRKGCSIIFENFNLRIYYNKI